MKSVFSIARFFLLAACLSFLCGYDQHLSLPGLGHRGLTDFDASVEMRAESSMPFRLPDRARTWCTPPFENPLPQSVCKDFSVINEVEMGGGLTNALKMVLLGAIRSLEEHKCFYVREDRSHLVLRKDPKNSIGPSFINRYFEPIGLPADNPQVLEAKKEGRIVRKEFIDETWTDPFRRMHGTNHNIASLSIDNVDGHDLKRRMLRLIWRPLPHVREQTCRSLEAHGLDQDYLAFSVRRGDKFTEKHEHFATTEEYIDEAEKVIRESFAGVVPRIFVATDDCDVIDELRVMRPKWQFESQCDKVSSHGGFAIEDMTRWTPAETDAHFMKFFVELYGIVSAKIVIGVGYTNVAWWAYFMRQGDWSEYKLLDHLGKEKDQFAAW
jgi:hypothetical protein